MKMSDPHLVPLGLLALIGGCSFAVPIHEDPTPILGCFSSSNAPSLSIDSKDIRIVGTSITVPYSYEQHKVGMIIRASLKSVIAKATAEFGTGDDQFFRVIFEEGKPVILVVFGSAGDVKRAREYAYRRVEPIHCST